MIKVGLDLDQAHERELVRSYVKAVYLTSRADFKPGLAEAFEESWDWFDHGSVAPLLSGTVVIRYARRAPRHWSADWEFDDGEGRRWCAGLVGDGADRLRPGPSGTRPPAGGVLFADWLMNSKPQPVSDLSFKRALDNMDTEVVFSANPSGQFRAADASFAASSASPAVAIAWSIRPPTAIASAMRARADRDPR